MTREDRKKIRTLKAQIQANAEVLAEHGDLKTKDGSFISNTIIELFTELREIEAIVGPDVG